MKAGSGRWGAIACAAMVSIAVAGSADAKTERGGRRSTQATITPHRAKQQSPAQKLSKTKSRTRTQANATRRQTVTTQRSPRSRHSRAQRTAGSRRAYRQTQPTAVIGVGSAYPSPDVLSLALRAYACGESEGAFDQPYLTIIDYSLPSDAPRLWVLDVRTRRALFHELVAHGRNSGETFAVAFSNDPGSHQSSIGLYRTEDIYNGQHGGSLRLTGLEPGYNDLARDRAIVMHGAYYVSTAHVAHYGKLGRSLGCPALPLGAHRRIIERIQGGSAIFAYYPDRSWLKNSRYLHCNARLAQR